MQSDAEEEDDVHPQKKKTKYDPTPVAPPQWCCELMKLSTKTINPKISTPNLLWQSPQEDH